MRLTRPVLRRLIAAAVVVLAVVLLNQARSRAPRDFESASPDVPSVRSAEPPPTPAVPRRPLPTQGVLAQTLASRLGLGEQLSEDRAIGLLAARGIAPEAGWAKSEPASEAIITHIQKTFHVLLTDLTTGLEMRVPPTVNLIMFKPGQSSGQTIHVGARDMTSLLPNGGVLTPEAMNSAQTARVSIQAPHPFPVGDDRLPAVWTYRLRHPGARFMKVHFQRLDLLPPSHLRVLDRYGQEIWRHIGGDSQTENIWSSAVVGDTAIIVLHAGAVAAGAGIVIDSYDYGARRGPNVKAP